MSSELYGRPSMDLSDRVAVVMGAGSIGGGWSNGKACAASYARAGAKVICVDSRQERAENAAEQIRSEGFLAVAMTADATNEEDVRRVVDRACSEFGRIDIMHNNVGVGSAKGTPDKTTLEEWNREFAVNVTSVYLGTRFAVPPMQAQGGGVIINTSSTMAVRFSSRPSCAYTSAKAAVEALTKSSAAAYGADNIRVNCLRIGLAETPIIEAVLAKQGFTPEERKAELEKRRDKPPLRGEPVTPFDVGAAAVFLASDAARSITGMVMNVDRGLELNPF